MNLIGFHKKIIQFFQTIAVTDQDAIEKSPHREKIIQTIKGEIILTVGVFAFFSGTFAAFMVCKSIFYSLIFGFFWGFLIVSIDRLLISPFKLKLFANPTEILANNLTNFLLRIPIAYTLGKLISIPLVLIIFQYEIQQEKIIESVNKYVIQKINTDSITKQELSVLKLDLIRERDSIKIGPTVITTDIKSIPQDSGKYIRSSTQKVERDLINEIRKDSLTKRIRIIDDSLRNITFNSNRYRENEMNRLTKTSLFISFGEQYKILDKIKSKEKGIRSIHWWITAFIIMVELVPVLSRLLTPAGIYDMKLERQYDDEANK